VSSEKDAVGSYKTTVYVCMYIYIYFDRCLVFVCVTCFLFLHIHIHVYIGLVDLPEEFLEPLVVSSEKGAVGNYKTNLYV